jgi:hypothetical protein
MQKLTSASARPNSHRRSGGPPVSGAVHQSVDSVSRFLRFFKVGDTWYGMTMDYTEKVCEMSAMATPKC